MLGPDYEGGPPGDRPARHRTPERSFTTDDSRTYSPYRPPRQNGGPREGRRPSLSPSAGAGDRSWDDEGDLRQSQERNRSRGRNGRQASGGQRICKKCGEPLTGQFVRALDGTFHLDCFKCRDCGQIVASKFFPADDEDGQGQYPLCETDYFRRLGLLCYQCGGALRGSYITALERKYHVDHFTCSLCSTVFGAQDSYYEHDSQVYCHYHYSTQFAQKCNGCHTAILKQFVEIFRNGQNQHWHPECYMIHKFWNVRLATPSDVADEEPPPDDEKTRDKVREEEEKMEEKVYRIWSVLSTFEESSAACISDMLLHVSNGAYVDGVVVAKRFIWHVDILFRSADRLDETMQQLEMKPLSYSREAKLLCKKIVQFFSLLSKTQDKNAHKLGVTQELLSLVTGLAHYLKLLIRICLQGALRIEKDQTNVEGLYAFLDDLSALETLKNEDGSLQITAAMSRLAANESDQCVLCRKPVEDECAKNGDKRWHIPCVTCTRCGKELGRNPEDARLNTYDQKIFCSGCESYSSDSAPPFERITKLQQYVFLLQVALARLLDILKSTGALSALDEASVNEYEPANGSGPGDVPRLQYDSRSKSYAGDREHHRESSYENTLNDVRRLRSTRLDKHLSASFRKARASRLMDDPGVEGGGNMQSQRIEEDQVPGEEGGSDLMFGHQDALTLDDIPRIVAAEQAREQRPAFKPARQELFRSPATEPFVGANQRSRSAGRAGEPGYGEPSPQRGGRKYFSELSPMEYFIARHLAVLTMHPMVQDDFTLEELLNLIESKKPATFWNKFGKAFKNDSRKGVKKKGVFGVPLEMVIERDGAESTDCIGGTTLRVPAIIDDLISTMRQMDLSVEGVFRKNGNIKKLSEMVEKIDREGCDNINLMAQPVVQVAALLKKYLREMPDPLMTNKLYRLWLVAAKIQDDDKRRQCIHLVCCLLPKCHRDCLEVLLSFLKWAGNFHQVDDESGSKMDVKNLATVIAPNILYNPMKGPSLDSEPMMAINVVETLINDVESMCLVPDNFVDVLNDPTYKEGKDSDITTKEILKRYGGRVNGGHGVLGDASDMHPTRPLARRVETDPEATRQPGWQEPNASFSQPPNPSTPPRWRNPDETQQPAYGSSSFEGSDSDNHHQRRSYHGRPNNSVGVGGTG
ncbi:Rho-type GTPase activating protein Rga1 [Diaporthe eres]|uniref:Rho-type GTPase activating protein Rga1 n=1 Tax=Diaporthe eres TaxID=83184 RepID=A0ABR1PPG0_DIAER